MATEEDVQEEPFVFDKVADELADVQETELVNDILDKAHGFINAETGMTLYDMLVGYKPELTVEHALALLHGEIVTFPRRSQAHPPAKFRLVSLPGHTFVSQRTYDKWIDVARTNGFERSAPWCYAVKMRARTPKVTEEGVQWYAEQ